MGPCLFILMDACQLVLMGACLPPETFLTTPELSGTVAILDHKGRFDSGENIRLQASYKLTSS